MATHYKRTNLSLGVVASTKLLGISTVETVYTLGTGNIAIEATNLGPSSVYYGNSGLLAGSGGLIVGNGSKFWDSIVGNFQMRFITASGSANLVIHEYAGN